MLRQLTTILNNIMRIPGWSMSSDRLRRRRVSATQRVISVDSLEVRMLLSATAHEHEHGFAFSSDDFRPASYSLIEPGSFLTPAQSGDALAIADGFLRSRSPSFGLSATDLSYRLTSSSVSEQSGTTHIYLQQTLNGLDILNAVANVSVAKSGAVVSAASSFVSTAGAATARALSSSPVISAAQALQSFATKAEIGLADRITSTLIASNSVPANVLRHGLSDVILLSAPGISRQEPAVLAEDAVDLF